MDTIDTTPATDTVTSDADVVENTTNNSFGKEVTKTLATSLAITALSVGSVVVAGFAVEKFRQFKTRRAEKVTVIEGEIVDDIPETVTTEK